MNKIILGSIVSLFSFFILYFLFNNPGNNDSNKVKSSPELSETNSTELSESEKMFNDYNNNPNLKPVDYGYFLTDSSSIEKFLENESKSTVEQAFDFMKSNSKKINESFCYLNDLDLFEVVLQYNKHTIIPLSDYLTLFSEKTANEYFDINPNNDSNNSDYVVTRKFERCYGYNEVLDQIQFIVTGRGAAFPSVYLLIYNKETKELISDRIIYKIENIGQERFRIKSCLDIQSNTLVDYEITESGLGQTYKVDTVKTSFQIGEKGEVELKHSK